MSRILHITCDYGDQFDSNKTPAVANLVQACDGYEHVVFSLNRTTKPGRAGEVGRDGNVFSLRYFGLPAGIGLRIWLERAASRLLQLVKDRELAVDLVHCHKLTFEGPVGRHIADALDCPYVCTVRGDTDLKLLTFKPTYRNWYRSVLGGSKAAFFVAPWTERKLAEIWPGSLPDRRALLPNIVELPAAESQEAAREDRIVSVFHLKDYRRKNLRRLMDAVDECWQTWRPIYLDVIGGGSPQLADKVESMIRRQRHPEAFRLLGHSSRDEIANRLPGYAALVLPSRRETFGMVYLEALLSGIPFLQSRDTGLDGYFDGDDVSIAVDRNSTKDIAMGIRYLLENGDRLRANVRALRENDGLARFSRQDIVRTYSDTIADVLGTS